MQFNILSLQEFPEVSISCFPNNLTLMHSWIEEMNHLLDNYQDFILIYPLFDPQYFEEADPLELKACRQIAMQWFQHHETFVLLYPIFDMEAFTNIDPEVSQAARKIMILWLKKNREIFQEKCKGILLRTKPDQSDLPSIEQQATQVNTIYRVPAKVLFNEEDKTQMIEALINA